MQNTSIIGSCEVAINSALKRLSKVEGKNKEALVGEYKEWLDAIQGENQNYDVLYLNKIEL